MSNEEMVHSSFNISQETMIKNYFKTAWCSFLAGRSFSVINVAGLRVCMAEGLIILLWLQNEISFDKFHVNKNELYEEKRLLRTPLNLYEQTDKITMS